MNGERLIASATFLLGLSLVLVFYKGATADFAALSEGARQIAYALTFRNSKGTPSNYPATVRI